MNISGTKYVWAVRTGGRWGVVQIFATKPRLIKSECGVWWSNTNNPRNIYYDGELWGFCGHDFNKIATLPIGRPVKLTIKVTLR